MLRRVQQADGAWRYLVVVDAPAEAVARIEGQGYDTVPTERRQPAPPASRPAPPRPDWVLEQLPWGGVDLHTGACWMPGRVLPGVDRAEARVMVDEGRADASCTICHPGP